MAANEDILNKTIQTFKARDRKALELELNKGNLKTLLDDKLQLIQLIKNIPSNPYSITMLIEVMGEGLLQHLGTDKSMIDEFSNVTQNNIYLEILKNKNTVALLVKNPAFVKNLFLTNPKDFIIPRLMEAMGVDLVQSLMSKDQKILLLSVLKNENAVALLVKDPAYVKALFLKNPSDFIMQIKISNLKDATKMKFFEIIANDTVLVNSLKGEDQNYFFDVYRPNLYYTLPSNPSGSLPKTYFSKKVGHVLGLSKSERFEGSPLSSAVNWLTESLNDFKTSPYLSDSEKATFDEIYKAFQFSGEKLIQGTNAYHPDSEIEFHKKYLKGEMIFLPTGWKNHAVSIVIQGNYLIYTNRGEAGLDPLHGAHIFEIKDRQRITPALIKSLINEKHEKPKDLIDILSTIVDISQPLVSFPSKSQEHGNCTYANPKASVEPMQVLVEMRKKGLQTPEQLKQVAASMTDRKSYKDFSKLTREEQIKQIILFAKASSSPEMDAYFIDITSQIIIQHHGQAFVTRRDAKKADEINRIVTLVQGLPTHLQIQLLENRQVKKILRDLNQPALNKVYEKVEKWESSNSQADKIQEFVNLIKEQNLQDAMEFLSSNWHSVIPMLKALTPDELDQIVSNFEMQKRMSDDIEVIRFLQAAGTEYGKNMFLKYTTSLECTKILIEAGTEVKADTLRLAILNDQTDKLSELLKHSGDLNQYRVYGESILALIQKANKETLAIIEKHQAKFSKPQEPVSIPPNTAKVVRFDIEPVKPVDVKPVTVRQPLTPQVQLPHPTPSPSPTQHPQPAVGTGVENQKPNVKTEVVTSKPQPQTPTSTPVSASGRKPPVTTLHQKSLAKPEAAKEVASNKEALETLQGSLAKIDATSLGGFIEKGAYQKIRDNLNSAQGKNEYDVLIELKKLVKSFQSNPSTFKSGGLKSLISQINTLAVKEVSKPKYSGKN